MAGGKSWILGRYGGDGGCSLGCQQSHHSEDSDDDASYNGDDYGLSGASDDIFEMFESVISFLFALSLLIIKKREIRNEVKSRLN